MSEKQSSEDVVRLTIIRTSDAVKKDISMPLSTTKLNDLKKKLSEEKYFGHVAATCRQRIFYLGRELKSGGRSLCNLGLGKFNNNVLHLYIRPGESLGKRGEAKRNKSSTNVVAESSVTEAPSQKRRRRNNAGIGREQRSTNAIASSSNTIELLDSSDDDDDEVEVIDVCC